MTLNVITPPVAMMATALQFQIKEWCDRANELLPSAHARYLKQIEEERAVADKIRAGLIERKKQAPTAVYQPKPFPYETLSVAMFQISHVQASEILAEIFRCWIATRSVFEKPQYVMLDELLAKTLPWYKGVEGNSDIIAAEFYADVIDNAFIQIHDMMESFIPRETWDVWSVISVTRSQFVIKNDGDYRVLEWEQLVQSGVVECPIRTQTSAARGPNVRKVVIDDLPHADWNNAKDDTGTRVNPIPKGSIYELLLTGTDGTQE